MPHPRCSICSAPLDAPGRPWSQDCGGDCVACMAEAGDPECAEAVAAMRAGEAVVRAARALLRSADNYSMGGRVGVSDEAVAGLREALPPTKEESDG